MIRLAVSKGVAVGCLCTQEEVFCCFPKSRYEKDRVALHWDEDSHVRSSQDVVRDNRGWRHMDQRREQVVHLHMDSNYWSPPQSPSPCHWICGTDR